MGAQPVVGRRFFGVIDPRCGCEHENLPSALSIMKRPKHILPSNLPFHQKISIHSPFPHKALFVDVLSFLATHRTQQIWRSSCDAAGRRRRFHFGLADSTGQSDWSRLWTLTCWTGHGGFFFAWRYLWTHWCRLTHLSWVCSRYP